MRIEDEKFLPASRHDVATHRAFIGGDMQEECFADAVVEVKISAAKHAVALVAAGQAARRVCLTPTQASHVCVCRTSAVAAMKLATMDEEQLARAAPDGGYASSIVADTKPKH